MSASPGSSRPATLSLPARTPPPFLRRPSSVSSTPSFLSTSLSEASSGSSDEFSSDEDDSDEDDAYTEAYWSSSGLSGDEARFPSRLDLSLRTHSSNGGGAAFLSATAGQTRTASPVARSNLRLSLAVLRARQSLAAHSYDALAAALKSLSTALPSLSTLVRAPGPGSETSNPLGVFVPTLARLAADVRAALRDEGDKGREFRRTKLAREDAKALVALKQRWSAGGGAAQAGGKGKGRETDSLEWVAVVEAAAAQNPLPDFLADPTFTTLTPALLTSLEAFLLPSSLPRLSLSALSLTDADLVQWPALRRLEDVTAWYFSFVVGDSEDARNKARKALDGVKSLDLSKNKLTTFPFYLCRLFPHLETLSLSHNQFRHLPPWVTLFASLRRLRTHGNRLVSARKALKPLARSSTGRRAAERARLKQVGTRADVRDALPAVRAAVLEAPLEVLLPSMSEGSVPSLFTIVAELVHAQLAHINADHDLADHFLPPHLDDTLACSYTCASCRRFLLPSSPVAIPAFAERAHHLDPGISIPSRLPPAVPFPALSSPAATPPRYLSAAERPATLEQRLLLALLARIDAPPPPPRPRPNAHARGQAQRRDSEASVSSHGSAPPPRRRDRDRERDRAPVLPTVVLSAPEWRFCALCAAAHLGMDEVLALAAAGAQQAASREGWALVEGAEQVRAWRCVCVVCVEERRVRGVEEDVAGDGARQGMGAGGVDERETEGRARVLRWFRRKEQLGQENGAGAPHGYGLVG